MASSKKSARTHKKRKRAPDTTSPQDVVSTRRPAKSVKKRKYRTPPPMTDDFKDLWIKAFDGMIEARKHVIFARCPNVRHLIEKMERRCWDSDYPYRIIMIEMQNTVERLGPIFEYIHTYVVPSFETFTEARDGWNMGKQFGAKDYAEAAKARITELLLKPPNNKAILYPNIVLSSSEDSSSDDTDDEEDADDQRRRMFCREYDSWLYTISPPTVYPGMTKSHIWDCRNWIDKPSNKDVEYFRGLMNISPLKEALAEETTVYRNVQNHRGRVSGSRCQHCGRKGRSIR